MLVTRRIQKAEADWLGIKDGWYGAKVSGTLMTERFGSVEECDAEIKKMAKKAALAPPSA